MACTHFSLLLKNIKTQRNNADSILNRHCCFYSNRKNIVDMETIGVY